LIFYPQEIGGFFESETVGSILFSYKKKKLYSGSRGIECDPTCCYHPGQIPGKVVEFEAHSTSREENAVD
jgi:hypothetical protein